MTCMLVYRTLYVLHKPGGYKQKQAVQDMKVIKSCGRARLRELTEYGPVEF